MTSDMIQIRYFEQADFEHYLAWHKDKQLNSALGPIDQQWLEFILCEDPPSQFSCLADTELVAVVGIARPTKDEYCFVVTDISVNPANRRSGIGSQAIEAVVEQVDPNQKWIAYVERNNSDAQRFFESLNWTKKPAGRTRKKQGSDDAMICYCRQRSVSSATAIRDTVE